MAGYYAREQLILFDKEITNGVDVVPTLAMKVLNYRHNPADGAGIARNFASPSFGANPALITGVHTSDSFEVELSGSGAAGTAPAWKNLVRACGHSETVTAATKVEYKPVTGLTDSGTEYTHMSGHLHKKPGWRGAMTAKLAAGAVPVLGFAGRSFYVTPTDVAIPAGDFSAWRDPLPVEKINTLVATLNGVALELVSMEWNFGQQVTYRNLPNLESITQTDRTGSVRVEFLKKALSAINPMTLFKAGTIMPVIVEHGIVAGNIVRIEAQQAQVSGAVTEGDSNGELTWIVDMALTKTGAGNDDYLITVK